MIEMLVAAFILAIGILGIVMLQAMSLRATRGSSNMGTAARVAGQIIDQAELEGRLSRLNITDANRLDPKLSDLSDFNLKYINEGPESELTEVFNIKGGHVDENSQDPTVSTPFFTVITRRVEIPLPSESVGVGRMSDFQIRVTFTDSVDNANNEITRTFNLSRRIIHG
jgi:type II secretory pathway pseudopilin PulG